MLWWNLQLLKFDDFRIRRRAMKSLGTSQDARALVPLTDGLYDEHFLVRKEAARSLGEIGDASTIKPLIRLSEESLHCAMVRVAVDALQSVLVRAVADATAEDLEEAAKLDDLSGILHKTPIRTASFTDSSQPISWRIDCSRIRSIAHRELTRRRLTI